LRGNVDAITQQTTLRRLKAPISAPRRHNLVLLDRHRVQEDFFERSDAALLHEAA